MQPKISCKAVIPQPPLFTSSSSLFVIASPFDRPPKIPTHTSSTSNDRSLAALLGRPADADAALLVPQDDGFVGGWYEQLGLGPFLVILVQEGPPRRLLEGIVDRFGRLGRSLKVGEGLRSHDRGRGGHPAPILRLFAGHETVLDLIDPGDGGGRRRTKHRTKVDAKLSVEVHPYANAHGDAYFPQRVGRVSEQPPPHTAKRHLSNLENSNFDSPCPSCSPGRRRGTASRRPPGRGCPPPPGRGIPSSSGRGCRGSAGR
jgi:hypothetical protein